MSLWIAIILLAAALLVAITRLRNKRPKKVRQLEFNMGTATLNWTLPTERASGFPLDPVDIASVEIALSADEGANWVLADNILPSQAQTFEFQDLAPGLWQFRAVVIDTDGRRSAESIVVGDSLDTTAPGSVVGLTVDMT